MNERRLLPTMPDKEAVARKLRVLRHRTARWFLPPVRTTRTDASLEPVGRGTSAARHALTPFETPLWRH